MTGPVPYVGFGRIRDALADSRGAATILFAASLVSLIGASAVAVDTGSIYLAKRRLQGLADGAALASAAGNLQAGARPDAQAMLDHSNGDGVRIASIAAGTYRRDATIAPEDRFSVGPAAPNALQIKLEQDVPIFFGKIITGKSTVTIGARATAARVDMAAFSVGSRLLTLSGGLPNQILSGLAGTHLNLSVLDGQSLADLDIDLLGFADALGARTGMEGATQADIFSQTVTLAQAIDALGDSAAGKAGALILHSIAAKLGNDTLRMDQLIDLGPVGRNGVSDPHNPITVDALSLVRAVLGANGGKTVIDVQAALPGVTATRLTLLLDGTRRESPWMTVTERHDVVVRTAQARLYVESDIGIPLAGIASLRLPILVELASAEARLSDIRCTGDSLRDGVDLLVTPSIGNISIADLDPAALENFAIKPTLRPAVLAQAPATQIKAQAHVTLGGAHAQTVHFSRGDVDSRTMRSVSTNDALQATASSLIANTQLSITLLGIPLSTGPVVKLVGSTLALVAPPLDGLLNQLTSLLGVRLGIADVRVERMRCGTPVLVA